MKLDYQRGAAPLYLQIKKYIKTKIENGDYPYGSLIPTEPEYEKMFNVSRITVRQAINELQVEGYVNRIRGRGTEAIYTKKIIENLNHIKSFTEEMKEKGLKPGTCKVSLNIIKATNEICDILNLKKESNVIELERIRTVDGLPIVVFITYLENNILLPQESEQYNGSLYNLIETKLQRKVIRVSESFEAMIASKEMALNLRIKKGDPILLRTRISYDDMDEPLEYTLSYYRGNGYKYTVELK